jgi:hypothetical protein
MNFGIYPGSAIGDDTGGIVTGPPDLPDAINDALDQLQGPPSRPFLPSTPTETSSPAAFRHNRARDRHRR